MREVLMSAGTITALVLFFVGVIKLPFKTFKEKHPHFYKATFFLLSLILGCGLPILSQLFILHQPILTLNFLVHILVVLTGVFVGYAGYENIGLKKMFKITVEKIKTNIATYSDTRIAKMLKSVGIDKIIQVDKAEKEKAVLEAQKKLDEAKKEQNK